MKTLIVISSIFILSACVSGPPIALVYKRYENPKGGRILVTATPETEEAETYFHNLEIHIMTTFCDKSGFRVIDEGVESSPGSVVSQHLAYGVTNSTVHYTRAQYKNFVCGDKTPAGKSFGPASNEP